MISDKYELPPQNLGNLEANRRVTFVRANGKSGDAEKRTEDPDDIPEASTSTGSDDWNEYRAIIESSSRKIVKEELLEVITIDDDDVIEVKSEPGTPNTKTRDVHAFLKAAKDGDLKEVRRLLEKKVPIDAADFYCWTATMCAAAEGNFEICKYLLKNNADPGVRDSRGRGIIEIARQSGHKEFVRQLMNYFCYGESCPASKEPIQMTLCESCNVFISESDVSKHITSITHQLNDERKVQGAAPQSGIQLGPSNIGYRLMCASGWSEEQGLGRHSDGHRFPIRTILKRNRTGLGLENPPKKVTHFGPFDAKAVKNERQKPVPVTKKNIEEKRRKEDRIAKKFRADFSDSDTVYDYFHGGK